MIGRNQNICPAELVDDNPDRVFHFRDCLFTGGKNGAVGNMAGLVYLIMINIHDLHTLYKRGPFQTFHPDQIVVLQSHACLIRRFQNFFPASGFC